MKSFLRKVAFALVAASLLLAQTTFADDYEEHAGKIVGDALILRPAGFVLTTVGAAFFVVTLPISLCVGGTKEVSHTLVETPMDWTFRRPLGTTIQEWEEMHKISQKDY